MARKAAGQGPACWGKYADLHIYCRTFCAVILRLISGTRNGHTFPMSTDDIHHLPDWPPPPDEPIGLERARAYIAWIRGHIQPALRDARELLKARHPGVAIETSAVTLSQLAAWSFKPPMRHLSVGV